MVFLLAIATSLLSLCLPSAATHHPHVNTSSGTIIGHRAPNTTNTFEFLGIKYAQAPVGDLRFAPPKRYVAPAGTVYNASEWNADCPAEAITEIAISSYPNYTNNGFAVTNEFTAHLGNPQNEDCLALNIWTKMPDNAGSANKAVMIFFHGGRFTIPGPHSPFYNGQYLADTEDVVVVTISYRLGIFGFSGAPGLVQNSALLDQRSAVEWARDNIAEFGGDPKRITIFGQSAGASSVDYYPFAFQADPIVAGLISDSGTAFSYIPNSMAYSNKIFFNVSGTLGCGGSGDDPATVVSCIRSKSVADILKAVLLVPALPTNATPQATFHPTVDNVTVWADYANRVLSGNFAKIPYLAGNNNYEAGFYRIPAYGLNITLSPAAWQLFTQRAFTCPTKYALDARAHYRVPAWRYRYMGDWTNLRLYPAWGSYPDSGAYHGSEMTMLFGTAYDVTGEHNTLQEDLTSRYIMGAWTAFARNPVSGLTDYGWPSYNANTTCLVLLAYENESIPVVVPPGLYDETCPPVQENDPLPGRGAF